MRYYYSISGHILHIYIYMQTYSHEFSVPGHIPKSFLYLNLFLHNILLCFCLLLFLYIITGGRWRAVLNISKLVNFCYMYLSYYCSQPVVMNLGSPFVLLLLCVCVFVGCFVLVFFPNRSTIFVWITSDYVISSVAQSYVPFSELPWSQITWLILFIYVFNVL